MLNKFTEIKRTLLFSILLLIAGGLRAENVYLLTAETINGTAGSYSDTISAHKFTLSSGTVYTYTITSLGTNSNLSAGGTFFFRIKVDGWSNEMQPYVDGDVLTINGDSYTITSDCYGNTKAWKVTVPASTYESITITVDLGDTKTVAVTGTASSETGSETTGSISAGDYYLVTNFVKGTDASGTSGDGTSINYNRLIFKFKQQTDGSYSVDIPATVTGHAQILGYDGTTKTIYGPSNTNVNYDVNSTWPDASNGVIPSSTTPGELTTGSTTLSEATNYWNFTTRNISGGDCDDGMYTINFTLSDGVPTNWTITHNAYKRVVYVVRADMSKPAQPLYDDRDDTSSAYDKKFIGSAYIENATNYYLLGNILKDNDYLSYAQSSIDANAYDNGDILPTVNVLMLQGNGNVTWAQGTDNANKVYANDGYFITNSTETGLYVLEYNPTTGTNEKAITSYGFGGELWFFNGAPSFTSVSMVGTAVSGTVTDDTWDYTSTVGDMTYNEDDHCYELTLTTTEADGETTFRFVANHTAATTWHEEDNTADNAARTPYNGSSTTGHTALVSDPNDVTYVTSDDTGTTDVNMIFNRPAGVWTVKFYIEATNEDATASYSYYYTIEGEPGVSITPGTSEISFGQYVTPEVTVSNPNEETTLYYVYTIDGTDPATLLTDNSFASTDISDGKVGSNDLYFVSYTPDDVIKSSSLSTMHLENGTIVDEDGTTLSSSNAITLTAYAVEYDSETSTYTLSGDVDAVTYTFLTSNSNTDNQGAEHTLALTANTVNVNKSIVTVTVTNNTTSADDGVAVYYTTDGTDPTTSSTRQVVRDRQIVIYGDEYEAASTYTKTVKAVVAGESTIATATADITYSTSESGYQNYMNNDQTANTIGGSDHIVIYVRPVDSNGDFDNTTATYLYGYEVLTDGTASYITPEKPGKLVSSLKETTVNNEEWYYLDLTKSSTCYYVNVQIFDKDGNGYATVADIANDIFLKVNTSTGLPTDVTPAYTASTYYSSDTKTEDAYTNPSSESSFIFVQVPSNWVTGGNKLKVLTGTTGSYTDTEATVTVQDGAETSANSKVCKVTGLSSITEGTDLIFAPFNEEDEAGTITDHYMTAAYYNGGYYYYESQDVNGLGIVFSASSDTDEDLRAKGHNNINRMPAGDVTGYLANTWTDSSTSSTASTTSVTDNWDGNTATVTSVASGSTISQTVTGLNTESTYTVQMIVRGEADAVGQLSLTGTSTATDSKTFEGIKNTQGTVTTSGRVEPLLESISTNTNGWQKLETSVAPDASGNLTIALSATSGALQLSDVTLLENANTTGYVWTKAPTSNDVTSYDLSSRTTANAFSFFDRGDNKNAIIYADIATVIGGVNKTASPCNVAVSATDGYQMDCLALTQQAQDGTSETDGDVSKFYADAWTYGISTGFTASQVIFDRIFTANQKIAACLPFSLSQDEVTTLFGSDTKVYEITAVDADNLEVTATETTDGITANVPFLIETATSNSINATGTFTISANGAQTSKTTDGYSFIGTYSYTTVYFNDSEKCYTFDPTQGGRFKYASKSMGAIIKPFRAYLKADATESAKAATFLVNFVDSDGQTTGITTIENQSENTSAPIYNLSGIVVSKDGNTEGLNAGVYIQNGKKIIVK